MKVNVEFSCTPEEARQFLGLPDVTKANQAYVEVLSSAMQGRGGLEPVQDMLKQIAPMGQFGLKMFQQFLESGAALSAMTGVSATPPTRKDGE